MKILLTPIKNDMLRSGKFIDVLLLAVIAIRGQPLFRAFPFDSLPLTAKYLY